MHFFETASPGAGGFAQRRAQGCGLAGTRRHPREAHDGYKQGGTPLEISDGPWKSPSAAQLMRHLAKAILLEDQHTITISFYNFIIIFFSS